MTIVLHTSCRIIHSKECYKCVQTMPLVHVGKVKNIFISVASQKLFQHDTAHSAAHVWILQSLCANCNFTGILKTLLKFWDKWYLMHNNHVSKLSAFYLINKTLVIRRTLTIECIEMWPSLLPLALLGKLLFTDSQEFPLLHILPLLVWPFYWLWC